jgi:hypothetical protein
MTPFSHTFHVGPKGRRRERPSSGGSTRNFYPCRSPNLSGKFCGFWHLVSQRKSSERSQPYDVLKKTKKILFLEGCFQTEQTPLNVSRIRVCEDKKCHRKTTVLKFGFKLCNLNSGIWKCRDKGDKKLHLEELRKKRGVVKVSRVR